jgi:histidinol-phosphate aminotransferase
MPFEAIRAVARRLPPGAVAFVDEAYAEFAGRTFIPELADFPNVIIGRTFSKAYGLAGLRIGCLIADPATVEAVRLAIPVYSVNVAAAVALPAALEDTDHLRHYLREVEISKSLLYDACTQLGLTYWKSDANFVLVCARERTDALVKGAAQRGVYVRDRSTEPGCEGCVRIATGIAAHTQRFIDVMEEVLCAAG